MKRERALKEPASHGGLRAVHIPLIRPPNAKRLQYGLCSLSSRACPPLNMARAKFLLALHSRRALVRPTRILPSILRLPGILRLTCILRLAPQALQRAELARLLCRRVARLIATYTRHIRAFLRRLSQRTIKTRFQ